MDGITEVFHAHFVGHAYPAHTHDTWTLLIVDDGAIRYDLDRHGHGAVGGEVTLLPPHVSHDGRAATRHGFRKRVLYLDERVLDPGLIGAAVGTPSLHDPLLRQRIDQLHRALVGAGPARAGLDAVEAFEAESRLAFVGERLRRHLGRRTGVPPARPGRLADELRELLDAHAGQGISLRQAAEVLHADPSHLVRSFTRAFGLPPHRYLTGRRIDMARRRLLAGQPAAEVAVAVGFHDQAHLTRHFRRYLGATPGRYSSSI